MNATAPMCEKCGHCHGRHSFCIVIQAKSQRKPLSWSPDGFLQMDLRDHNVAKIEFQEWLRSCRENQESQAAR